MENAKLSARTCTLGVSRSFRLPVGIMTAKHLRRCPSVTADGRPVPMLDICPIKLHDVLLSVPTKNSKFPIKLWQLVNNPTTESIMWDSKGEGVIINQHLFIRELLSPVTETLIDVFKSTNFRSFIRQMNLYGFRKLDVSTRDNNLKANVGSAQSIAERVFHRHIDNIMSAGTVIRDSCTDVQRDEKVKEFKLHHYHHPNFKKKHPELLVNVTRSKSKVSIVRVKKLMDPNKQQSNQKEKILLDVVNSSKEESMKKCVSPDPEQVHQALHVDYPTASPANQDNSQCKKNLDEDPVVQSMWPNSSESKETDKYFSKHSFPVSLVQKLFPQASNAKQSSSTIQHSQLDSLRTMDHNFNYYIIPLAQFHPASSLEEMSYGYSSASFNSESTGLNQHCFSFPHYNYQMPFPVGTQKSACPSCQCTSSRLEIMDMNLLHSQVQPESASKEKRFSLTGINIPNNTLSQMVPTPSTTPLTLKNSQMSTTPKIQTDGTVCSVSEASGVFVSPLQKQSNYHSQSWISEHYDQNNCASPSKQSLMSMKDESMTSYIYSENMSSILESQPPNLMLLADVACSQILRDNKLYRVPVIQSTNMKSAKALNK